MSACTPFLGIVVHAGKNPVHVGKDGFAPELEWPFFALVLVYMCEKAYPISCAGLGCAVAWQIAYPIVSISPYGWVMASSSRYWPASYIDNPCLQTASRGR